MSVSNSPRPSPRVAPRNPHAIDPAWALGRARDWLLGPAPLLTNLALFVFAALGSLLWQISQRPDRLDLPAWIPVWGVLVAIHAGAVVAYGTLRAWRSPRRGPVFYSAIPPEERTAARARQAPAQAPIAPVTTTPSSWSGTLAPVTPFPTRRDTERPETALPGAPNRADVTASHHGTTDAAPAWPATAARDSALADVRDVLASDQPLWRRWRRRPTDRPEPAPLPAEAAESWLSPFPGAPPVTRPAPAAPLFPDAAGASASPNSTAAPNHLWPAAPPADRTPNTRSTPADSEQLPSLAAMLRSNKLTTMSEAPITGGQPRPGADTGPAPAPMPTIPTLLPRPAAEGASQPKTAALFAAFGLDSDGNKPAPSAPEETSGPKGQTTGQRPRSRRALDAQ